MEPSYLKLYQNGQLQQRAEKLDRMLDSCTICPHCCEVNREEDIGFCRSKWYASVCSYCAHHGEEPMLSGRRGSGTIFFGNCNLKCVFCQNADISQLIQNPDHYAVNADDLADIMLQLQEINQCHNINFVSPSHFVPQIIAAVLKAVPQGLHLPLVYNSNGYDRLETLQLLDGIIDIYLPDLKYSRNDQAKKYSHITNYVPVARQAISEMYRQVGLLQTDSYGVARRGLIIRHLVLPNHISGSIETIDWIAKNLSPDITLSLMAQYHPAHKAYKFSELKRSLYPYEYKKVLIKMKRLGFKNAYYQQLTSADIYLPDFNEQEDPFNEPQKQ